MPKAGHTTRMSLLLRLRDPQAAADDWDRFYDLYAPLVYQYARDRRLSHDLAQDVLQETFVKVYRVLPTFDYDPARGRFRSWLLRVVHSRVVDAVRRERRFVEMSEGEAEALPDDPAGAPDAELAASWESAWRRNLLTRALDELKATVQAGSYEAFRRVVLEGEPADAVAADLGLERNAVYQVRHRLTQRLQQIVRDLELELGEA